MDRHFVKTHKTKVIKGNTGSYWDWANANPTGDDEGEQTRANPDNLAESDSIYANQQPTKAQLLLGEAIEHLQGRQADVYQLTMRQGLSIAQAARQLNISKSTAQEHKEKAIKFLTQYCRTIVAHEANE
jgi:RNA polymerase sigma factor (sigma-70 family)